MPYGIIKYGTAIAKRYALKDWKLVSEWALDRGYQNAVDKHRPLASCGYKRIDKSTKALLCEIGAHTEFPSLSQDCPCGFTDLYCTDNPCNQ